jgi:hypothetical protein
MKTIKNNTQANKNIFVLPTDKESNFFKDDFGYYFSFENIQRSNFINLNIYITSDEEIKDGDLYLDTYNNQIIKANKFSDHKHYVGSVKKIILTTDQDLIKDGIQAIYNDFLEWFVKNPSCDFVIISKGYFKNNYEQSYKIIIPKEDPLSFEEFKEMGSEEFLEIFYKVAVIYSGDSDYENYFYANCRYWEGKLKEELERGIEINHVGKQETLREKFLPFVYFNKGSFNVSQQKEKELNAKECEKITNEFAIGFVEWLRENYYDTGTNWHKEPDEDYTTEELIEIYKKENGL